MSTKTDIDLSGLENFEVAEETPPDLSEAQIYEKSLGLVKEAMKNVIQEMVVIDKEGTHHIAYITHLEYTGGQVIFEFNTPSENKDIVQELAQQCLEAQIKEVMNRPKRKKLFGLF
ncbi:head vertex assembly chaperone [Serratia phage 92A1]|nr:head vertex assembly chaperone [Serratia phage 92A1]